MDINPFWKAIVEELTTDFPAKAEQLRTIRWRKVDFISEDNMVIFVPETRMMLYTSVLEDRLEDALLTTRGSLQNEKYIKLMYAVMKEFLQAMAFHQHSEHEPNFRLHKKLEQLMIIYIMRNDKSLGACVEMELFFSSPTFKADDNGYDDDVPLMAAIGTFEPVLQSYLYGNQTELFECLTNANEMLNGFSSRKRAAFEFEP